MTLQCPLCNSRNIETLDYAKKTGATVGFVGGAASGAASALGGARVGATVGMIAGPVGVGVGSVVGALLGGLLGGTAGGITGAKLGQVIDDRLLENNRCLNCGHTFGNADAAEPSDPPRFPLTRS
jgi:phage tail tape-measure protein